MIEDRLHWEQRYGKVPVLDPVEGEHAPLFCLDPPSPDEVMRSLPDDTVGRLRLHGGNQAKQRADRRRTDRGQHRRVPVLSAGGSGPPEEVPLQVHGVFFDKTIRSDWPIPFMQRRIRPRKWSTSTTIT